MDRDEKPAGAGNGKATAEAMDAYMKHCYPSNTQLVARLGEIREQFFANTTARMDGALRPLDLLYLLTNGDREWVERLAADLAADGWGKVVSTVDLVLDNEQLEVSMAVDMEIARRAKVFVGNGVSKLPAVFVTYTLTSGMIKWSSFSSNVMHTRIRDNRQPLENRVF